MVAQKTANKKIKNKNNYSYRVFGSVFKKKINNNIGLAYNLNYSNYSNYYTLVKVTEFY